MNNTHSSALRTLYRSMAIGVALLACGANDPSHAAVSKPPLTTPLGTSLGASSAHKASHLAIPSGLSRSATETLRWVRSSGDNQGDPFVIVDKALARIYVFDANGKLKGSSPVLLGLAKGDDTVPGIGDKPLSEIKPEERTTPAGRFVAEPGINAHGVDVVWVDYDAAVSMHRVLTNNPEEKRLQRLASKTPKDNRISYGCINLPVKFYEKVLSPTVTASETVVYVLPETRPAGVVFGFNERGGTVTASRRNAAPTVGRNENTLLLRQLDGA